MSAYNHDTHMAGHAARRGQVTVTDTDGRTITGTLIAWRPTYAPHEPGVTGKYRARVLAGGSTRTYNLNHYTVEPT